MLQKGWRKHNHMLLSSIKCTVPVFPPWSPCSQTGTHPPILLKEALTCASTDKNPSLAAARIAFPAVVKFIFQVAAITNARMKKTNIIVTYKCMTLWPVFNTNISYNEVVVFNLQPIHNINTWRVNLLVSRGGKNKQSFCKSHLT